LVSFAERRSPRWLQQKRLARPLSIVIVYLLVLGLAAGIVSVYQRHDYAVEKRRALEAWGNMVTSIVSGEDPTVVRVISGGK